MLRTRGNELPGDMSADGKKIIANMSTASWSTISHKFLDLIRLQMDASCSEVIDNSNLDPSFQQHPKYVHRPSKQNLSS